MKKLVVISEESTSRQVNIIAEFLSMQYNYGLYDFNVEKILNDLVNHYDCSIESISIPYYNILDKNGQKIKLMFMEEYD